MGQSNRSGAAKWIVLLIFFGLLAGAGLWVQSCWRMPQAVEVEELRNEPLSLVLALNGRIAPHHVVEISPALTAYVTQVLVNEGDLVRQGQGLVELDAGLVQSQLAQAEAALTVQKARRDQAAAAAKRADSLGGRAISRSDLEEAETALATAQGEVDRLTAALQEVKRQLERYSLRAPISGVIISRNVEAGQLVGTQDSLITLAQPDDPFVETDVDELYAGRIALGQKALLRPVGTEAVLQGEVAFIAPRIDPATGGRKVKIIFNEPPKSLPFGLTVTTNIIVEEHAEALSFPRSALTEAGNVLVVQEGVLVEKRPDYVEWPADRLMLRGGLSSGELVVIDPKDMQAGDRVTVNQ